MCWLVLLPVVFSAATVTCEKSVWPLKMNVLTSPYPPSLFSPAYIFTPEASRSALGSVGSATVNP